MHLASDCKVEDPLELSVPMTELIRATVALAQCSLMLLHDLGNLVKRCLTCNFHSVSSVFFFFGDV